MGSNGSEEFYPYFLLHRDPNSMLQLGLTVMNRQKAKFIRELMLPYHETVRKIANPKVSTHEKRKLLQKAQVGEGVLNSVTKYLS